MSIETGMREAISQELRRQAEISALSLEIREELAVIDGIVKSR